MLRFDVVQWLTAARLARGMADDGALICAAGSIAIPRAAEVNAFSGRFLAGGVKKGAPAEYLG
ncbi:MAG: hypothetical protein JWQ17_472 [Tardiphaga sp.]|jgi:hypothetical protein|nr:hypothetical protein [Tardiphaga sp.]